MLRQSLRGLAIAAFAAVALGPAPAAAVTQVNACGNLTKAGETYVLTTNITVVSNDNVCFRIQADRITVDLAGHTITGPGAGGIGIWDTNIPRTSTVVKNGSVTNFGAGIVLAFLADIDGWLARIGR